jgi:dihydroxy-acid dehydratase
MNFGLSLAELQSGKPIIGIAQTGSDLAPCNRHHLVLAERVREGVREAGGIVLEFPVHPIQETGQAPTAGLDRNLATSGLVEVLFGYPLDGVVLTIGCDKTTPACLMAAADGESAGDRLVGRPMLNGWYNGERTGSGNDRVACARAARGRRDRLSGAHQGSSRRRRPRPATATRWARRPR